MKFFPLIWRNLMREKLRTTLTLLCIFIAFLLYGVLCIIKGAMTVDVTLAGSERLMTRHKVSFIQMLPISYRDRIAAMEGVNAVTHMTWFGGIYKDPKNMIGTFPVDPDQHFKVYPEYIVAPEVMAAWKQKRNGAIVGTDTMERFAKSDGWKIGSVIPFTSPIWGAPKGANQWEFEIVGVYTTKEQKGDRSSFLFRYDYFDEAREKAKGEIGWMGVRVTDPKQAPAIAAKIDQAFANSQFETKTETEAAAMQGWAAQIGDVGKILMSVLGAVFFTILIVAGNTMSVAVRERIREIGTLKALGFTHQRVLGLVLAESTAIALLGGLAGLAIAKLITLGGSPMPEMLPNFVFSGRDLLIGAGCAILLGILAGALPAMSAMRLQVAVALRRG